MKALVQDKLREWTQRFSSLGVKCQELTSDSGPTNVLDMLDTDIILTTPEVIFFRMLFALTFSDCFVTVSINPVVSDEHSRRQINTQRPEVTWR